MFSPSLCLLDGWGRSAGTFLVGRGVLEVRLTRVAESVWDPIGGLVWLVHEAETFGICLAGCFGCLVV